LTARPDLPPVLLIAAATGCPDRNRAFGIKLPLLGYPSMSLTVMAALTPKPFRVRLVDEAFEPVPYGQGAPLALIVGLTHHAPNMYALADRLRAEGTAVVLAGMHVSALPGEAAAHADAVIVGEGEAVWPRVLDDFAGGKLQARYDGPPADLDALPPPRRDLLDARFYYPGQVIETSRGCPVGCAFCGVQNFFGATFRTKSPETVRGEILDLFGARPAQAKWKDWLGRHWHPDIPYFVEKRLLYVMDSNFAADARHARAMCRVFADCDIRWYGHMSLNAARDEVLLDRMAASGCLSLNLGFESLSQANIDAMGKGSNRVDDYVAAIRRIHDRGMGIMGTFIVGFDGDTPEVFERIADFALDNRLETAFTLILTPLPGTGLRQRLAAEGRLASRDWRDHDHGTVAFRPAGMTAAELHHGMRSVWKRLYSLDGIRRRILKSPRRRAFFFLPVNLGFRRCTALIRSPRLWPVPGEGRADAGGDQAGPGPSRASRSGEA
jgi:radical SAM superfamily enzyme YgiQ (UPF0313 family)